MYALVNQVQGIGHKVGKVMKRRFQGQPKARIVYFSSRFWAGRQLDQVETDTNSRQTQ